MFAQQELDRVSHLATHPCIGDYRNIQGHFHGFGRQPICAWVDLENIQFRSACGESEEGIVPHIFKEDSRLRRSLFQRGGRDLNPRPRFKAPALT